MIISCVAYSCKNRQKIDSKIVYKGKIHQLYKNSLVDCQYQHALVHG